MCWFRSPKSVTTSTPNHHKNLAGIDVTGINLDCKYSLESHNIYAFHYSDVMMASQITSLAIVYSTVYSGADQRKCQSSTSLAFERGIHRWPVNSPHKWPVTRKMFQFDDVTCRMVSRYMSFTRETHISRSHSLWNFTSICVISEDTISWQPISRLRDFFYDEGSSSFVMRINRDQGSSCCVSEWKFI